VTWTVTFYSPVVEAELLALPAGFVARFIRYAERMEVYGPDLGMPHTRAMGDGLFELRLKAAEGIARGLLLHGGRSQDCGPPSGCEEDREDASKRVGRRSKTIEGNQRCLALCNVLSARL